MKLCRNCRDSIQKFATIHNQTIYDYPVSESECEFWAHEAWNDWMEEHLQEPTRA